jgi:hypothetical protein
VDRGRHRSDPGEVGAFAGRHLGGGDRRWLSTAGEVSTSALDQGLGSLARRAARRRVPASRRPGRLGSPLVHRDRLRLARPPERGRVPRPADGADRSGPDAAPTVPYGTVTETGSRGSRRAPWPTTWLES